MQKIEFEFLGDLTLDLAPTCQIGVSGYGNHQFAVFNGGQFEGQKLRGKVISGTISWHNESDGIYNLETEDGALIHIKNPRIYRTGPSVKFRSSRAFAMRDPKNMYFRTTPSFGTDDQRYAWLNRSLFVGTG
ncbi:MAG: hypothetical protein CMJ96_10875 [Planctomycetes bacterium]|nr:hypothetical protein [Planctomycetota bacterium]